MPGKVVLRIVGASGPAASLVFDEHDTAVVGRARDCRARLPDDDGAVSRHHFLLEVNPPFVRLRDLGSRHGTYVNGKKYGGRRPGERVEEAGGRASPQVDLRDGDEIRAGRTVLRVEIAETEGVTVVIAGCSRCGSPARQDPESPGSPLLCVACRGGMARPATDEPVSSIVPGYEMVRRLGVGGMGAVYLARRERDGVWVALKVMLARVAVHENARVRFLRESSIVEQLEHPGIVAFYERGAEESSFWFAMEFCPGGSLAEWMDVRGGKLKFADACDVALQVLRGLAYAHERDVTSELSDGRVTATCGVVHRDIKPANILLTGSERRWTAKLSDFGLAKCFETAGLSGCTVTGDAAGALPYMPREQLLDFKHVLPVSDVWSMGATLYEMLTGHPPRDMPKGRDPLQVILGGHVVPVRDRDPTIPKVVADVLGRALDEDTANRYPTAREFHDALAAAVALVAGDDQETRVIGSRPR